MDNFPEDSYPITNGSLSFYPSDSEEEQERANHLRNLPIAVVRGVPRRPAEDFDTDREEYIAAYIQRMIENEAQYNINMARLHPGLYSPGSWFNSLEHLEEVAEGYRRTRAPPPPALPNNALFSLYVQLRRSLYLLFRPLPPRPPTFILDRYDTMDYISWIVEDARWDRRQQDFLDSYLPEKIILCAATMTGLTITLLGYVIKKIIK